MKTLKYDTKMIKSKINVYGDADDEDLSFLEEKLEDLIMKIDAQMEERKVVDRKLRQLPRGRMMTWDTGVESYNDFKRQMQDMLIYDSDSLRLSTLKDQIRGKDKDFIADLLHNVEDLQEAFMVLDTHYGAKLDKLPSLPEKEED